MAFNNPQSSPIHLNLGLADPPIVISEAAYAEARDNNRRSLVGRILSPTTPDLYSVIQSLPITWCVDDSKSHGRIIENQKFQFVFDDEDDLEMVLWSGPYTYDGWLVVLQRWEDEPGPNFLTSVPIWVKITGIPIRYVCEGTIREIVSSLGQVMEFELDDGTFDLRSVRVRVDISVDSRLCFKKRIRFESGESKIVTLSYQDIAHNTARFKFCVNCGALIHLAESCSYVRVDVPDPNDPSLSSPHHDDTSSDDFDEDNGEDETSLDAMEQLGLADLDTVQNLPNGNGEEVRVLRMQYDADDIMEKWIQVSSDVTNGFMVKPLQEE